MSRERKNSCQKIIRGNPNNTAMLTTFNEFMTNVMELRKRKKEQFMQYLLWTKLGFMSFFTKAS
ncbi:hypothetical protein ACVNPX_02525 [Staphylococcus aureus]